MKTATDVKKILGLLALASGFLAAPFLAQPLAAQTMAVDTPLPMPPTPPGTPAAAIPARPPSMMMPDAAPKIVPPGMGSESQSRNVGAGIVMGSPPEIGNKDSKDDKDDKDDSSSKVPQSVKSIINHLSSTTHDVTLEDLNAAREAVAKLDALIDIEKRLSDLEAIRHEREEKSGKALAAAIPASALGLPNRNLPPAFSMPPSMGMPPRGLVMPAAVPSESIVVQRIEGGNGNYAALIKGGDSKGTLVHVGDHLPDGSIVRSITAQGVEIEKEKTRRVVQVKDVTTVFGSRNIGAP